MTTLKPGDTFPNDIVFQYALYRLSCQWPPLISTFRYIPWSEDSEEFSSCGIPINYNASKEWANKKVVLFSVPGE